jgi:hypothetical protein
MVLRLVYDADALPAPAVKVCQAGPLWFSMSCDGLGDAAVTVAWRCKTCDRTSAIFSGDGRDAIKLLQKARHNFRLGPPGPCAVVEATAAAGLAALQAVVEGP